jgi:hypothetical protein
MNRVHQPLYDLGQLQPVGGLDVERERRPLESKPAHLEGKHPFRVAEYAGKMENVSKIRAYHSSHFQFSIRSAGAFLKN